MPEAPKNVDNGVGLGVDDKNIKALEFIEDVTMNAKEVQMRVLSEILTSNSNVEYLQRHGLKGSVDCNKFKKIIPVVAYDDLLPDVQRIANGDRSPILCSKPISEFLTRWVCVYLASFINKIYPFVLELLGSLMFILFNIFMVILF